MSTSKALVEQNEPLQTHTIIQTNIRVNRSPSRGHFPWTSWKWQLAVNELLKQVLIIVDVFTNATNGFGYETQAL